jgi:uncharacterized DUF497 family protein
MVDISFDSTKSEKNVLVRGVPFELAAEFAWDGALIVEDLQKDYGAAISGVRSDRRSIAYDGFHAARQQGACDQSAQGQQTRGETI